MGDTKAAGYLYKLYPQFDRYALAEIDSQAAVIFHRLRKMHIAKYGRSRPIIPRPGAESGDQLRTY
ncbi:MAG TPA: hypothetical protein VFG73_01410 [Rhodanobacteraceae bacterium]|nr:hypothetical protein [Rhodanobacteraceae bacterium]